VLDCCWGNERIRYLPTAATELRTRGSRFELESVVFSWSISGWPVSVEKAERVRYVDYSHTSRALPVQNLIAQCLHSCPMHLRPEMMFRVVPVVEPGPVVEHFRPMLVPSALRSTTVDKFGSRLTDKTC
jgi:hypothetical protein